MRPKPGFFSSLFAGTNNAPYRREMAAPFGLMVTVLLTRPVELGADAVCFGFRGNLEPDTATSAAQPQSETDPAQRALGHSAFTRGPAGWNGVPISMRFGGSLRLFGEHPFHSYGQLLAAFQSRLIALAASEANPQPMRYIEIGYNMSKDPIGSSAQRRRFVEVDLSYEEDNTFWVFIRKVVEVDQAVRVSQSVH
jgi:hypothetical protein